MKKEITNMGDSLNSPFAAAVKAGDYIFVSGQVGHVDAQGNLVVGIEAQTRQCLENIKRVLDKAGATLDDVVKVTVFLREQQYFATMNQIYRGYFPENPPARSTIVPNLALPEMLIEIDCIAYRPQKGKKS